MPVRCTCTSIYGQSQGQPPQGQDPCAQMPQGQGQQQQGGRQQPMRMQLSPATPFGPRAAAAGDAESTSAGDDALIPGLPTWAAAATATVLVAAVAVAGVAMARRAAQRRAAFDMAQPDREEPLLDAEPRRRWAMPVSQWVEVILVCSSQS